MLDAIADFVFNAHFWRENFILVVTYFQAGGNMIPQEGLRQAAEAWAADKA